MKYFCFLILLICIISVVSARPLPGQDKGKGKAKETTPPPSRPGTPTPQDDPSVPLPGRSGHHVNQQTGVVTTFYGDDHLPEHMGHLQRNQAAHPLNRQPMSLHPSGETRNRENALAGISTAAPHPVSGEKRVRDEKLPNMMNNPHHSTSTTVEYLPKHESDKEGGLTGGSRTHAEKLGDKAKVQLRPNPGWLPLHPDQRRGHEAPARLNSETRRPDALPHAKSKPAKDDHNNKAEASKSHEGYTPKVGDKELRHRPGKAPPPPPPPPKVKKVPSGPTNLQPGRQSPPGHVWRPNGGPHIGAPGHLTGAEQRYPPRPQNRDHHLRQQAEAAKKKQAESTPAAKPKPAASPKDPKHAANLAKFNKLFPLATPQTGSGRPRAHEAPAVMMTARPPAANAHANPHASPHAGPSNLAHPANHPERARTPSPQPRPKSPPGAPKKGKGKK